MNQSKRDKTKIKIVWWYADFTDGGNLEFDGIDNYETAEEYATHRAHQRNANLISVRKIVKKIKK